MRLVFAFFIFLAVTAGVTLSAEEFFPLEAGNYWHYRSSDNQQFHVDTSVPFHTGGRVYHVVRGYVPAGRVIFVREVEGAGILWSDLETDAEKLLTSFDAQSTPVFPADFRPCGTAMGTVHPQRVTIRLNDVAWKNVLRITYQSAACGEPTVESELYAPGVGMVQRTVRNGDSTVEFNLVYARVNGQTILTGRHTSTSIIFSTPVQGATRLQFMLLSSGNYGLEPDLRFPTSQRYDLVLRDRNGNKLWQYSAGKAFVPVFAFVSGPASYDIEVPLDELPGRTIEQGQYTVEAWFATEGPHPLLAASAKVFIGDFGQPPAAATAVNRTERTGSIGRPLPGRPLRY